MFYFQHANPQSLNQVTVHTAPLWVIKLVQAAVLIVTPFTFQKLHSRSFPFRLFCTLSSCLRFRESSWYIWANVFDSYMQKRECECRPFCNCRNRDVGIFVELFSPEKVNWSPEKKYFIDHKRQLTLQGKVHCSFNPIAISQIALTI